MPTEPSVTWASSLRRIAAILTVGFVAVVSVVVTTVAPARAALPTVTCRYALSTWSGGFSAELSMANSGSTIDGWIAHWTFATPTRAITSWSARLTQANPVDVVAAPMSWNRVIATGAVVSFGWTGIAATTEVPTDVTVNGTRC